jgi:NAD(P)H-hydrate epimerase
MGYNPFVKFGNEDLRRLWKQNNDSSGEDNGQVTIIGGSELFSGAPIMSTLACSRIVDMVFLATPEVDKTIIRREELFSKLRTVIWIPEEEVEVYVEKSDAVLIGPGFMRYKSELQNDPDKSVKCDEACARSRELTKKLLLGKRNRKWVIDGGSLQVMDPEWIPTGAVITPNKKEYQMLFGETQIEDACAKYKCVIVRKDVISVVSDGQTTYEVQGGNAGLTKGGTGDVLAGVIVGLLAKNDPLLAAAAGSFLVKRTAEILEERVGLNFNADDVADKVFEVWKDSVRG